MVYEGDYASGTFWGKGKSYSDGILVYQGEFKDGEITGYGQEFFEDGTIAYEGYLLNG